MGKKSLTLKNTKVALKRKTAVPALYRDITSLIDHAKARVAFTFNSDLVILNWQIGKRIEIEILKQKRAGYGKQIVATLSQQLTEEYGTGYSIPAISRMLNFVKLYSNPEIVATLSQQFSWSHIIEFLI